MTQYVRIRGRMKVVLVSGQHTKKKYERGGVECNSVLDKSEQYALGSVRFDPVIDGNVMESNRKEEQLNKRILNIVLQRISL